ncbi:MAG: hypothetical protein P4M12_04295 [Gammaproteobacteria bacterium]|nr:hypothetical protein [Gammaproteobacteria bacterium]
MNKKLKLLSVILISLCSQTIFAKQINLYEQPKDTSKIVSSIDSNNNMVPIFTPKEGDWIKIGNPSNGDVGWIKVTELDNGSSLISTRFSITQQTINTSKGPKTLQTIQFSLPQAPTKDQTKAMLKQFEIQQQAIQNNIMKMMHDMFISFDINDDTSTKVTPAKSTTTTTNVETKKAK